MRTATVLLVAFVSAAALAQEAPAPAPASLDTLRADLAQARFEEAIAEAERLLGRADLGDQLAAEVLALRAQAWASTGNLGKAEEDWRRLLLLSPSFLPDPTLVGHKGMERFEKVQAAVVGTVRLALDPRDAKVVVDGKPVIPAADGSIRLAAGGRRVSVARHGFDPAELGVTVQPGTVVELPVRLVPNARGLVVRTQPDGVEVRTAGRVLGTTSRPAEGEDPAGAGAARLVIEDLPLGEYVIELAKPCYRTVRLTLTVSVDVSDRSPLQMSPVALEPARAAIQVRGGPAGADLLIDGAPAGHLPVEGVRACAGRRSLEVRTGGRAVWRETVEAPEDGSLAVDVGVRPNAVVFGAQAVPPSLASLAGAFSTSVVADFPPGVDLTTADGWSKAGLPADTDLAIALLPAAGELPARTVLYSPAAGAVVPLEGPLPDPGRPAWRRASAGWRLADSAGAGRGVVVEIAPGGPAAMAGIAAGDRVSAVAGRTVTGAREIREAVAAAVPGVAIDVALTGPDGAARTVHLTPAPSPVVAPRGSGAADEALLAAWSAVDAAAGAEPAIALANLASILQRAGRADAAATAWGRVRLPARRGVGDGTAAYGLGRALETLRRDAEAREAFTKARASEGTAFDDDGPAIAPAAADHLADLGVTLP